MLDDKCLLGIINGIPANLEIDEDYIYYQLARRHKGHGRGKRMKIDVTCKKGSTNKAKGDLLERLAKKLLLAQNYDVIEDIRELHEKEEDLLMELEDLSEESDMYDEGDEV